MAVLNISALSRIFISFVVQVEGRDKIGGLRCLDRVAH